MSATDLDASFVMAYVVLQHLFEDPGVLNSNAGTAIIVTISSIVSTATLVLSLVADTLSSFWKV